MSIIPKIKTKLYYIDLKFYSIEVINILEVF